EGAACVARRNQGAKPTKERCVQLSLDCVAAAFDLERSADTLRQLGQLFPVSAGVTATVRHLAVVVVGELLRATNVVVPGNDVRACTDEHRFVKESGISECFGELGGRSSSPVRQKL